MRELDALSDVNSETAIARTCCRTTTCAALKRSLYSGSDIIYYSLQARPSIALPIRSLEISVLLSVTSLIPANAVHLRCSALFKTLMELLCDRGFEIIIF